MIRRVVLVVLAACAPHPAPPPGACAPPTTDPDRYAAIPYTGYDQASLKADIDAMRAGIPVSSAPPSDAASTELAATFARGAGSHHIEAARGFRGIALDDTSDRLTRQLAQYSFAVELHALKLDTEARTVFRDVAAIAQHPRHELAVEWLSKTYCE